MKQDFRVTPIDGVALLLGQRVVVQPSVELMVVRREGKITAESNVRRIGERQ